MALVPSTTATYANYEEPSTPPSDLGQRTREDEPLEPDYSQQEPVYAEPERLYSEPEREYVEPERVYAEPEQEYAEPEKVYAEPEKVYAEPERVYAEPEQVYGEPEQVYAEPERVYGEPEQNYEVDEATSVLSNGRVHGVQQQRAQNEHEQAPGVTEVGSSSSTTTTTTTTTSTTSSTTPAPETRKSGYVLDGKHYRKYRVEEETPDGFIVGEYGVVSHHDGNTRGVRYTADSSINPRVIYEALAKFLALRR